ncbi:hypothetical protein ACFQZ8_00570 [Micromonospora azadirachtae]|uniref:FXSXX-COOH protein n=1 Tax=Micromonospora azadirachtae TaxID=1970735 RepID=A0ABW2ZUV7_9ACTN
MNIGNIVATLKSESTLAVESSADLVEKVRAYARIGPERTRPTATGST